ncbi:hypothetical protein [Halorussus sp. AFM4]|uniref:hypothetical protein n=1 Tax=Halorussus sp. AFM4 TaxID=3421651 RepID=UPI003EBD1298
MSDDGHRERFALAVGMVACGWESLPEAAERRDVNPENVARALSRHAHRADYGGRLWADRRRDDTMDAAEIAEATSADVDTIKQCLEATGDALAGDDGIGRYDPEDAAEINPDPGELVGDDDEE